MKIGEFANKFGLNVSTVRYYINNGLLIPVKKAEQYEFDKNCEEDMKNILKYKGYHFTIEEIQLLFFLQKTSRFKDDVVLGLCSDLLEKKRKELINEKKEMEAHILSLENEIEGMPKTVSAEETKTGIPFSFIPYLYCPRCRVPLKLDSASMAEGALLSGELWCECGYNAGIKEGMILCGKHYEDTPFKAFENIESVMAMVDQFSPSYRKLIDQTNLYMYNQIHEDLENPMVIMTGPFTLNFLLAYIDKLNKKNIYIISDPSKKRLEKIQAYLSEGNYNIVYLAGEPKDLPIKEKTADIFIDDFCTVNSLFTYNTFNTENIAPILKSTATITGIFSSYTKAPKGLINFKKIQPEFKPEKMTFAGLKYGWEQGGFGNIDKKTTGYTSKNEKDYPQDVLGEQVEVIGYKARRGVKRR